MAEPLRSAGPGHNGNGSPVGEATQAMMYDFLDRHEEIVEGRKRLNKRKKELVAEIEKAGIPIESWLHFLKTREQAGVIRERIDAAWRQLQAWDAKPVGVQSGMDLTAGQDGALNADELARVDREGFEAGKNGRKRESSPYTPGTEAAQRFDSAWLRGQAEIAASMAPDSGSNGIRRRGRPPGSKNRPKEDEGAGAEAS